MPSVKAIPSLPQTPGLSMDSSRAEYLLLQWLLYLENWSLYSGQNKHLKSALSKFPTLLPCTLTCNPENYTALDKVGSFYGIRWHPTRVDIKLNLHLSVWGEEQEMGETSLHTSPVGKSDQNLMENIMEKAGSGHTFTSMKD